MYARQWKSRFLNVTRLEQPQQLVLVCLLMDLLSTNWKLCTQIYGVFVPSEAQALLVQYSFIHLSSCVPVVATAQATSTISLDLYLVIMHARILERH